MPYVCERAGTVRRRWLFRGRVLYTLPSEVLQDRVYWVPPAAVLPGVHFLCVGRDTDSVCYLLLLIRRALEHFERVLHARHAWALVRHLFSPYFLVIGRTVWVPASDPRLGSLGNPVYCIRIYWPQTPAAITRSASPELVSRFCFLPGCSVRVPPIFICPWHQALRRRMGKPPIPMRSLGLCRGCRLVRYCCVSHQKRHWKYVHRFECTRRFC